MLARNWFEAGSGLAHGCLGLPQGWFTVGLRLLSCWVTPVSLLWGGCYPAGSRLLCKSFAAGQVLVRDWISDGAGLVQGRLAVGSGLVQGRLVVGSGFTGPKRPGGPLDQNGRERS